MEQLTFNETGEFTMSRKQENGKGGNFDTRANPFAGVADRPKTEADYTEVSNLGKALQVLIRAGCAVILGGTRDGGAMVVTILDGDQRHRTYCSTSEELEDAFSRIEEMYGDG